MKNFILAQRGIIAACAAACAGLSLAQTAPELKPIVVTASRNPQQLTDTLPHTTVLQRADIERSQAADVISLLQREAGVQFTQNGGRGTSSSLYLRGSASLQTLVLLDGVPLTRQDATGSLALEHLTLEQIERIEIVRGNVSAIYGSGAIGGVVQIFSKRGRDEPTLMLKAEMGMRGSRKTSLGVQGAFGTDGATRLSAGVTTDRTDGISAINKVQQSAANPDKDGYDNRSENFSISHEMVKGHTLGLKLQRSDGKYAFDSSSGAPEDIQTGRNRQQTITAYSDNRFTTNWLSRFSITERTDRGFDTSDGTGAYISLAKTTVHQVQWNNTIAIGQDTSLTLGFEQQNQSINANDGFAPYQRTREVKSVFGGVQTQFGAHQFQLNLRNDKAQDLPDENTAYLGYGYKLSQEWKLTASRSTAFNIAPLGYLYYPFGGNANLKPEKAKSSEIGLQWSRATDVLRATLFSTRSKNLFEYDTNTNLFANVANTRNSGLEVSYSGKIASTDVRASLTSQNPQNNETGKRLNRRAKTLGSFSADHSFGKWQLGADLRFSGSRRDDTNLLDSYEVMDLRVRYTFDQQLSAYARIENLFDRKYQTVYSYNQAPRGMFVGMQWQPKF